MSEDPDGRQAEWPPPPQRPQEPVPATPAADDRLAGRVAGAALGLVALPVTAYGVHMALRVAAGLVRSGGWSGGNWLTASLVAAALIAGLCLRLGRRRPSLALRVGAASAAWLVALLLAFLSR